MIDVKCAHILDFEEQNEWIVDAANNTAADPHSSQPTDGSDGQSGESDNNLDK